MESANPVTLPATGLVSQAAAGVAQRAAGVTPFAVASAVEQTAVQDAPLPPRRRAQDAAEAPGFPASPHVAQLLAEQVFPPATAMSMDGLAVYHSAIARQASAVGRVISLQA